VHGLKKGPGEHVRRSAKQDQYLHHKGSRRQAACGFGSMTILYALVTRQKTVLAEYTATSGNFPTIVRVLLGKIEDADDKKSLSYDAYVFHYIVENHIIYMCMCDDVNKRRVPFLFLDDIKKRFVAAYGARAKTAIAFAMVRCSSVV
jgi:Regulated-SNARE-like domain